MNASSRRARTGAAFAAAALLTAGLVVTAAPATAATGVITENGGATQNGEKDTTQLLLDSIKSGPAKNVILIIGDGMSDSELTIARNYQEGAAGRLAGIDALPLTGDYTTYAVNERGAPNYASESASTATAWSTGTKTVNGRLSVDVNQTPQTTMLEYAKANGLKTGNVSTAEIQDASPAAQYSHVSNRGCYGPDDMGRCLTGEALEKGGLGSITEQLLNARPDVTLGGGSATFAQSAKAGPWSGQTLQAQAEARGFTYLTNPGDLGGVTVADQSRPLIGLFAAGNLPTRWDGPAAMVGGATQAAAQCEANPAAIAGASLDDMTKKALELLPNENGFFLQVEGASIDKQNHAANACGQIGETVDLDAAVQSALEFAKADGETLVVVTADHSHTSQIVGGNPPGLSVNLTTTEGQSMIVSYGTSLGSQQHTGAQARIAAYGPGAANVVGFTDQTDLFFTATNSLELNRDLAALNAGAAVAVQPGAIAPGQSFTFSVSGMPADGQVVPTLNGATLDPVDLVDGATTITATAPNAAGSYTLSVRGTKSTTTVSADFTVTAGGTAAGPGTGGGSASAGSSDPLAFTGSGAPWAAGGIALLLLVAGALVLVLRRRHAA